MLRKVKTMQSTMSLPEWRTHWPGGIEKIVKKIRDRKKNLVEKRKNQKFPPDLGMPRKVAKQQITLACSTLVAMRLILTDDLDEEDKTGMTQAHPRGQDWHYANTHTQLVATNWLVARIFGCVRAAQGRAKERRT